MSTSFPPVAIIGLGLMGGSLALALKAHDAATRIIGITRSRQTLDAALERRVIDTASDQLSAVRDAGLVVLAAPVRTILNQIPRVAASAPDGAILLDLGSTKRAIVEALDQIPERLLAVGGHPMCGKEIAGFEAAEATLYRDKLFVLSATKRTTPVALDTARALAQAVGSRVLELDAVRHDQIAAAISHLPYVAASNLTATVDDFAGADSLVWQMASSGFRDTSRLAASDVPMMMDILLTNGENVAHVMQSFARRFADLAAAIRTRDETALRALLESPAEKRRSWRGV